MFNYLWVFLVIHVANSLKLKDTLVRLRSIVTSRTGTLSQVILSHFFS